MSSRRRVVAARVVATRAVSALVMLVACHAQSATTCELYQLINARLALMQDVAAYKWHRQLPIEDRTREARVLESSVREGLRVSLVPDTAEVFFGAQIAAAKAVQQHWFTLWAGDAAPPARDAVPDLVAVTRPRLLALGADMVRAMRHVPSCPGREAFFAAIDVAGVSDPHKAQLYSAVAGLRFFADRLEQVRATGVLRVGTTGDYAPFSHRDSDAAPFAGVDIEMALDLAAALGVAPEFVPTSWPRLMTDLLAGAFDIGMSGVSLTAERQREGAFSVPYYTGGKTPIARCEDAGRFASLVDIDQPGVRMIVNPGGTNERFVKRHIRLAQVTLHPDNRSIFAEILQNRADVMITDRVEVQLQVAQHPQLCSTMPDNLNRQQKAYLLPQDAAWKDYVDAWLTTRMRDGAVAAAFANHGVNLPR